MGPLFTSRAEWRDLRPAGRDSYLRTAVGLTLEAGAFGLAILVLVFGASEPHWRSTPVLVVMAAALIGGGLFARALFGREWNAAERSYGAGD